MPSRSQFEGGERYFSEPSTTCSQLEHESPTTHHTKSIYAGIPWHYHHQEVPKYLIMDIPSKETRIKRAIQGYKDGRYPSLSAAAKALEVPPSTIKHRYAGRRPVAEIAKYRLTLNRSEEKSLIEWLFQLHRLGVPARPSRLREMAQHVRQARSAKKQLPPLSPKWVTRFCHRHPEIKSVLSTSLEKQRWDSVSRKSLEKWFPS
jgi:Tc5 transposase DNA-binding domain